MVFVYRQSGIDLIPHRDIGQTSILGIITLGKRYSDNVSKHQSQLYLIPRVIIPRIDVCPHTVFLRLQMSI
jgi:hypothetical protein